MNKIVNKFLQSEDKFMPELHLRYLAFTYNACRPFTKHRERIKISEETGNLNNLYSNKLSKACFAHYAGYIDSKYLPKRTISNKILKDRAY